MLLRKKRNLPSQFLNAYVNLKTAICASASLRIPDPNSPFILETDASNVAIGTKDPRRILPFHFVEEEGEDGHEPQVMHMDPRFLRHFSGDLNEIDMCEL